MLDQTTQQPTPQAQPEEEFIPKSVLTNRLAEKERKHQNELAARDAEIQALKSQSAPQQIAQQAATNVMQATNPAPQPAQPVATPPVQPQVPQLTPEHIEAIRQQALQEAEQKRQAEEQEKARMAIEQKQEAIRQSLEAAKQSVASKIDAAAQSDPDMAQAINMASKNKSVAHDATSMLIGHGDDAPKIFKKLMNTPEHYAAFIANSNSPDKQAELLTNIAKQVTLEDAGNMAPRHQTNFAATAGASNQKAVEDMNPQELRKYYKSKGLY